MSRAPKPLPLSTTQARQVWLRAQRLDTRAPFGEGAAAVAEAIAHLGYVQIDTINVIERSHHHILFTRIPAYRRADLRQAQSVDRSVFEYWTHALSYVPSQDFRFFLPQMKLHRREGHAVFARSLSLGRLLGDAADRHLGLAGGLAPHRGLTAIDAAGQAIDQPGAFVGRALDADIAGAERGDQCREQDRRCDHGRPDQDRDGADVDRPLRRTIAIELIVILSLC